MRWLSIAERKYTCPNGLPPIVPNHCELRADDYERGPYDGFEDVALHGRWPEETARRKVAELGFTIPTETKPPRGVAARFLKPLQPARIMEHDSVADIDEGPLLEQLLASPFGLDSVLHMARRDAGGP